MGFLKELEQQRVKQIVDDQFQEAENLVADKEVFLAYQARLQEFKTKLQVYQVQMASYAAGLNILAAQAEALGIDRLDIRYDPNAPIDLNPPTGAINHAKRNQLRLDTTIPGPTVFITRSAAVTVPSMDLSKNSARPCVYIMLDYEFERPDVVVLTYCTFLPENTAAAEIVTKYGDMTEVAPAEKYRASIHHKANVLGLSDGDYVGVFSDSDQALVCRFLYRRHWRVCSPAAVTPELLERLLEWVAKYGEPEPFGEMTNREQLRWMEVQNRLFPPPVKPPVNPHLAVAKWTLIGLLAIIFGFFTWTFIASIGAYIICVAWIIYAWRRLALWFRSLTE
jgi:hypothetical protein